MNKYIRTKDGKIFNLIDLVKWGKTQGLDEDEISFWNSAYRHPEKHKLGLERRILKQADTIEELVDAIVIVDTSGYAKAFECQSEEQKKLINDVINLWGVEAVYGEIWVDGELHKVAKMNEKGKLELL